MDSGFALLLLAALVLSGVLSLLQHRAYSNAAKRLSALFHDRNDAVLVSGRGKGRLRGAVALLVVDSRARKVIAAEAMVGASVLARFRAHPELIGLLSSAPTRAGDKHLAEAVRSATEQYKVVVANSKRS